MGAPFFRFKQFTVWHDRCAMKVGTDGVLLGAWCPIAVDSLQRAVDDSKPIEFRVLDVGTGSGLIALMLAQRLQPQEEKLHIHAIDIDTGAVEQSRFNFVQSPWAEYLESEQCALQEMQAEPFDLIVSNPPYFQDSLKNPNQARATARHTDTLSYRELIRDAARLLAKDGMLALILPIEAEKEIIALAQEYRLSPSHITYVHSKPGKEAKRILIAFSRNISHDATYLSHFYIESPSSPRSEEYQELTKEFYL